MSNLCVNTCSVFICLPSVALIATLSSLIRQISNSRGYCLETSPDPIAMVIRVALFTHKPSEQIGTAWLLMCLLSAGLVDKLLDSNYHGNWVWVGFEIIPPSIKQCVGLSPFNPLNKNTELPMTFMHHNHQPGGGGGGGGRFPRLMHRSLRRADLPH